jgi:hypothetical protein
MIAKVGLFSECVEIDERERLDVQRPIDKGVKSECEVFLKCLYKRKYGLRTEPGKKSKTGE